MTVRIVDLPTHSLRRAKVALVYKKACNLRARQLVLGHWSSGADDANITVET